MSHRIVKLTTHDQRTHGADWARQTILTATCTRHTHYGPYWTMSLLGFCEWLASTRGSIALHGSLLMYPLTESVHVWALTMFVGLAIMLDVRLLGLGWRRMGVTDLVHRIFPWMVAGFVVMVVSGVMLFYAIPVRTYQSVWFRAKIVMLILAGINVWVFHTGVYRTVAEWDLAVLTPRRARLAGTLSLILWASTIFAGRFIAYNWFDCDRQPQPAIVNFLAGCVIDQ